MNDLQRIARIARRADPVELALRAIVALSCEDAGKLRDMLAAHYAGRRYAGARSLTVTLAWGTA